jgi:hypothetical protein
VRRSVFQFIEVVGIVLIVLVLAVMCSRAQTPCPADSVCYSREQNNQILQKLNEYVAAKDLIIKLMGERGAAGATIDAANKVIEAMNAREEINGQIILKLKDLNAVYEKVIALQQTIIEKLTMQLNKPKSAFAKFMTALKEIALLAAGIALGRGGL